MPPNRLPRYIIRKTVLEHCQRGAARCEKCREMYAEKYCLLDLRPPGEAARRSIAVRTDAGRTVWCDYDIAVVFDDRAQAGAYARTHGITDVEWE